MIKKSKFVDYESVKTAAFLKFHSMHFCNSMLHSFANLDLPYLQMRLNAAVGIAINMPRDSTEKILQKPLN